MVGLHLLEGFPDFPFGDVERLYLVHGLLLLPVGFSWPVVSAETTQPLRSSSITEPSSLVPTSVWGMVMKFLREAVIA
jgi:hypothetical protein